MTTLLRKAARSRPSTAGLFDRTIIDNFAGLGGASFGIKLGTNGRSVDVCVNHCPKALEIHAKNHPETRHLKSDVWEVDPYDAAGWETVVHIRPGRREADHRRRRVSTRQIRRLLKRAGRPVGLAWFSPDCRHFSGARGSAPVSPRVRSLAWIVVKYARTVRPEVMMVENVRQFQDWGPTRQRRHRNGRPVFDKQKRPVMEPVPEKKGQTFKRWVRSLEREGYVVEWRVLDAADYGVPQHRRRLFVIARRDGKPIKWPEKTHGKVDDQGRQSRNGRRRGVDQRRDPGGDVAGSRGLLPYRTAAEVIDWSIEPTSIFDRPEPLAENTQRRLFAGFLRYVVEDGAPFVLRIGQQSGNGSYVTPIDAPIGSIVTKQEHCLGGAYLIQGYGERDGQAPRASSVLDPLGAVVGTPKHRIAVPMMLGCGGAGYSGKPTRVDRPFNTVLPHDRRVVVVPWLERLCGGPNGHHAVAHGIDQPLGAVTTKDQHSACAARLTQFRGTNEGKGDLRDPAPAVCAGGNHEGVAIAYVTRNFHGDKQSQGVNEPLAAVTTQTNKFTLVLAWLMKFYSSGGQWGRLDDPLGTVTTKDRFAIVTVRLESGATVEAAAVNTRAFGWLVVADILMRMFVPRELARAQGFPDTYVIPTNNKSLATRLIGNSVPPPLVAALTRANCPELCA